MRADGCRRPPPGRRDAAPGIRPTRWDFSVLGHVLVDHRGIADQPPSSTSREPLRRSRANARLPFFTSSSGSIDGAAGVPRRPVLFSVAPNWARYRRAPSQRVCDYTRGRQAGTTPVTRQTCTTAVLVVWRSWSTPSRHMKRTSTAAARDSTLQRPRARATIPAVLDEARWEPEFLMRVIPGICHGQYGLHGVHDRPLGRRTGRC